MLGDICIKFPTASSTSLDDIVEAPILKTLVVASKDKNPFPAVAGSLTNNLSIFTKAFVVATLSVLWYSLRNNVIWSPDVNSLKAKPPLTNIFLASNTSA